MRTALFMLLMLFALTSGAQTQPITHTIQPGETLYRLSLKYEVSVNAICQANPGLSADNFKAGAVIRIPSKAEASQMQSSVTSEGVQQTTTLSKCRDMHKVARKETIYGIAKQYSISEYELRAANPEMNVEGYKLKKGTFICIPYPKAKAATTPTNESMLARNAKKATKIHNIKMAVLLPFSSQSDGSKMVEYYRGVLMAVDSMKHMGENVEIYAYNSGETEADMTVLLNQHDLSSMHLIIGPLYSAQITPLANYAKKHKVRLVLPFNSKSTEPQNNSYIYQINSPQSLLYPEVYNHFFTQFSNINIVLLDAGKYDKSEFIKGLKAELQKRGLTYRKLTLNASQSAIAQAMNSFAENIIIPTSGEISVLNTLMPKMKQFMASHPEYIMRLFGFPEWQTYTKTHLENFYQMDTYFYTTFYNNPLSRKASQFDRTYLRNFHSEQSSSFPRYGMLGFDTGYYFLYALANYGDAMDNYDIQTNPYELGIHMKRVNNWGGFVNQKSIFVNYSKHHTIIKYDFD